MIPVAIYFSCVFAALFLGFFAGRTDGRRYLKESRDLKVEVGPSENGGVHVQHLISSRIVDREGRILHFERVDMREDGWEERLAELNAGMKAKAKVLEVAQRIAGES